MQNGKPINSKKILTVSLCLLAAVYLIYHIARGLRPEAEFFAVRPYTAYDSQIFTGYIFREETVLTSRTAGSRNYHYYDGEKVPANRSVADIYTFENKAVSAKIADIKKQIEIFRSAMSLGKLTVSEVNQKIELVSYEIIQKNAAGDTAAANTLSDKLLVLMAKKELLTSGKSNYDAEIANLESQKNSLVASLGTPAESILTSTSGYFYSHTDGYEEIFTTAAAKLLTVENFDLLSMTAPANKTNAIGTLVTSAQWYYAAKVPEENADGFLVGTVYDCLFLDNGYTETIPMKLISKETASGQTLLVYYSSSMPRDFDTTRVQRMQATRGTYEGFRIPTEVVRAEKGKTFVYIFNEGTAKRREVVILWEQNGYYIVSANEKADGNMLALNDLIIINDTDLYENKFIN
ncbi:MAG: hypothetical protein E7603_01440 [Ruminococcaceae bacterium]|nr:hypothetical protein [Oscillospiraceae bacterium]